MRRVVTSEEMRTLDRRAVETWGIPGLVLMENAGRAAADELGRALPDLADRQVALVCGRGNNGGDGFVICRHLLNRGINVVCILLGRVADLSGDARVNAEILLRSNAPLVEATEPGPVMAALDRADVIGDALFGTGLTSAPRDLSAQVIEMVNTRSACRTGRRPFVFAVDVPSGVDADSGRAYTPAVRADLTVTMGLLKHGLLFDPGRTLAGRTVIADIGIPSTHLQADPDVLEVEADDIADLLPSRPPHSHKGTFGTALIIAGSRGYSGALCLAGMAAVRAGAGLVRLAFPAGIADIIESRVIEPVKFPLPETETGALDPRAIGRLVELAQDATCVAIGPGLGAGPGSQKLVRELLPELECPLVIDADALNCLAGHTGLLRELKAPALLTPHPGEMARLGSVYPSPLLTARSFAVEFRVHVILKGAPTVISAPCGPVYVNSTGGSGLATAGSGDVLTGLVAGLIAQGCAPLSAAVAATWLHGRAGDLGSRTLTSYALAAGDLLDFLPAAFAGIVPDRVRA